MKRKFEVALYLGLGTLLGLGIASYRTGILGAVAQGQAPTAQVGGPRKKPPRNPVVFSRRRERLIPGP